MNLLTVHSRHTPADKLAKKYPGATILDLTSRGEEPWVRFSPFFPHGGVPIPGSPGRTSASVEGVWQGLKVFESADVDHASFTNTTMRGLKRTIRRHGPILGHRAGVDGPLLTSYEHARRAIYLPTYRWALEHRSGDDLDALRALWDEGDVVLLDYETNGDVTNLSKPLSHAWLVVHWLRGRWAEEWPLDLADLKDHTDRAEPA